MRTNDSCFFAVFGTFGSPNGFDQTVVDAKDDNFLKDLETFDLNTNAIQLEPDSEIYAIRKNRKRSIAYCKYTYAQEPKSSRNGAFVGSGIVFTNGKTAEESVVVRSLDEYHRHLIGEEANLTSGTIINVSAAKHFKMISGSKYIPDIKNSLRKVSDLDFTFSGKSLVVYTTLKSEKLHYLFKNSIDLLNRYDGIYFTANHSIAKYVKNRNIFKLVETSNDDFENEIRSQKEEREKQRDAFIEELKQECKNLEHIYQNRCEKYTEEKQNIENKLNNTKSNWEKTSKWIKNLYQDLSDRKISLSEAKSRFSESKKTISKQFDLIHLPPSKPCPQQKEWQTTSSPHNSPKSSTDVDRTPWERTLKTVVITIIGVLIIEFLVYDSFLNKGAEQIKNTSYEQIEIKDSIQQVESKENEATQQDSTKKATKKKGKQ